MMLIEKKIKTLGKTIDLMIEFSFGIEQRSINKRKTNNDASLPTNFLETVVTKIIGKL